MVDHPVDGRRSGNGVGEDMLPLGEDQAGRGAEGATLVAFGDERELGIHSGTVKKYLNAEGPPTRQSRMVAATSSSDTIEA